MRRHQYVADGRKLEEPSKVRQKRGVLLLLERQKDAGVGNEARGSQMSVYVKYHKAEETNETFRIKAFRKQNPPLASRQIPISKNQEKQQKTNKSFKRRRKLVAVNQSLTILDHKADFQMFDFL